jgi:glycine/D-amino acid oxidase-like deaminating enzyme/nitrite reductase/ring-hydroxylating ferredoxin subunit
VHRGSGASLSLWMATAPLEMPPRLQDDLDVDVAVIGAGIAGLTTAYLLAGEGRSVVVLDDGAIGGGETSRTTGHLASALDDRFHLLEQQHGLAGARIAARSHAAAIDRIEQIVRRERIDCDFARVPGYLFVPPDASPDILTLELDAARRAGLEVEAIERPPVRSFDFGPALRFGHQARFHVLRYLNGLVAALRRRGGPVLGAHVEEIRHGAPLRLLTSGGPVVTAAYAVVATNSPFNDRVTMHTKQAAYRTYVVALPVARGAAPDALLWDTPDPYHYVRLCRGQPDWPAKLAAHDWLIVGGEDHKTGQPEPYGAPFARLEDWARARFPVERGEVLRWSGQVLEPVDGLAFIGHNPVRGERVFIATGDSGNGLTHATLGAQLIADLVQGRHSAWQDLYDPARKTLRAAPDYVRENLNVAAQFVDWFESGEPKSARQLKRGQGAVIRRGLRKVAAYRDTDGTLHQHSAACPHLGCAVAWNAAEQTFDCPCHGSRFDKLDGHPLNGPAASALAPVRARSKGPVHARRHERNGRRHARPHH